MGRSLEHAWATERGFGFLCDCGLETIVDTIGDGKTPTPMEFAVTCDNCGTSHWFQIIPPTADGAVTSEGEQNT